MSMIAPLGYRPGQVVELNRDLRYYSTSAMISRTIGFRICEKEMIRGIMDYMGGLPKERFIYSISEDISGGYNLELYGNVEPVLRVEEKIDSFRRSNFMNIERSISEPKKTNGRRFKHIIIDEGIELQNPKKFSKKGWKVFNI